MGWKAADLRVCRFFYVYLLRLMEIPALEHLHSETYIKAGMKFAEILARVN